MKNQVDTNSHGHVLVPFQATGGFMWPYQPAESGSVLRAIYTKQGKISSHIIRLIGLEDARP